MADLVACLDFTCRWLAEPRPGAQVLGVHVEGPYFCRDQSGAQDPANVRNPDDGTPAALLEYHNVTKILTYAPELPGALDLTHQLNRLGIVPAAGHSSAKETDV
jgi:N-acetylglucosamine-6-phosphate deacetylase